VTGKKVCVHLAQIGSVGKAQVGQLVVPEGRAHDVHVFRGAGGVDEWKHPPAQLATARGKILVGLDRCGFLLRIVEHPIESYECVHVRPIQAAHRRAAANTPWVESDQVEFSVENRERGRRGGDPIDSRRARPTRIYEERADPFCRDGGGFAIERDVDGSAGRM